MMHLPPTSMSLLSEMFRSNAAIHPSDASGESSSSGGERNERKQTLPATRNRSAVPPSPLERGELLSDPSVAKPRSGSRTVRYHPSVSPRGQPVSSARRTGRRKSPPQKIRRASDAEDDLSSASSRSSSRAGGDDDEIEIEPRSIASGPITCFSFRTMEKEYEKDTQRMLERIEKSRSFERSEPAAALGADPSNATATATPYRPWNSCHLPGTASTPAYLESSESEPASDSGFFIGDLTDSIRVSAEDGGFGRCFEEGCGGNSSSTGGPPSLALLSSYGDTDWSGDQYFDAEHDCDGEGDDEKDEIFELDL